MSSESGDRVYGQRLVADRLAERRARFLDAALEVFCRRGYRESSITDICKAAGLSRRQFYELFSNSESVLLELYDGIQQRAQVAIVEAVAKMPDADIRDTVSGAMGAYARAIGADPRYARIAFVEIVGVNPRIEEHRDRTRSQWIELARNLIEPRMAVGTTPLGGYQLAISAFIGAANTVIHDWAIAPDRPDLAEVMVVLDAILAALVLGA